MKKTMLILICAVVIGMSAMTAAADERENIADGEAEQEYTDSQVTEEPMLIAPSPDVAEDGSDELDEEPMLISPLEDGEEPSVNAGVSEIDGEDFVKTAGVPTLAMICVVASTAIALFVFYKKK